MTYESFNVYPQGLHGWVAEIGWKPEDIAFIDVSYETIEECVGNGWVRWKPGNHVDVAICKGQDICEQRFIRLDNGDWQKES